MTAGKALYSQAESDNTAVSTANTTQFWVAAGAGGGNSAVSTTEANAQTLHKNAGTLSSLTFSLQTNSIAGGSTVFTIRKNSADGNMTISVAASTTGNFSEGTPHTDTIAAGDKISLKSVPGGATGTFGLTTLSTTFTNTSSNDTISRLTLTTIPTANTYSAASTTNYENIAGEISSSPFNTVEANAKVRFRKGGTIKNAGVFVVSNARTTNTTFTKIGRASCR